MKSILIEQQVSFKSWPCIKFSSVALSVVYHDTCTFLCCLTQTILNIGMVQSKQVFLNATSD